MTRAGDSEAFSDLRSIAPKVFSGEFLQEVIESLPEALVVIDRDRNIVMANRAARVQRTCSKCYQCFHQQKQQCSDVECPVQLVGDTKSPVRVYHTHYGEDDRKISVAIDAAPMFDEQGEVVYTIETCRDVTERTARRRLSRIGNRHMTMTPLLAEYTAEISGYSRCSRVRIHLLDENCADCDSTPAGTTATAGNSQQGRTPDAGGTICVRSFASELAHELPPATHDGSIRIDHLSRWLSGLPEPLRQLLGPCVWQDCESVALVPIRYANDQIALLQVADVEPNSIAADLVTSLERLSSELGAAIHRVRLEEAFQEVRDNLELRVRKRTEQLTKSNEALQKEIEERSRLERELLEASVREQQRIGQELHDGLGQELTGISYLAQNLVMNLKRQASPEVDSAKELTLGIQTVVGEIQQIVRGLVPLAIGAADLTPALEVLASNVERQTGVTCRFETNGEKVIMEDNVAIQIYRIAQEAITNVIKHAQADEITITLSGGPEEVGLEVFDNGIGIQLDTEQGPGCGLPSMRHRARAIGGRFDIRPCHGGGTIVECLVPRPCPVDSDSRKQENDASTDHR